MAQLHERWSDTITMREAYLAMIEFAWTYYRVGGEKEDQIEFFASHIATFLPAGSDGSPPVMMDRALEKEWFEAVDKVRASA
jgi:hypothetical protein